MAEPGSGAAGGIGFALRHALPDSRFVEGFALVSEILCLKSKMETADMILTGEGGFDGSSLSGKGPFSLLQSAGAAKKVRIYCGVTREDVVRRLASDYPELSVITIRDKDADLAQAIRDTATNLNRAVAESIAQTS